MKGVEVHHVAAIAIDGTAVHLDGTVVHHDGTVVHLDAIEVLLVEAAAVGGVVLLLDVEVLRSEVAIRVGIALLAIVAAHIMVVPHAAAVAVLGRCMVLWESNQISGLHLSSLQMIRLKSLLLILLFRICLIKLANLITLTSLTLMRPPRLHSIMLTGLHYMRTSLYFIRPLMMVLSSLKLSIHPMS